jgi:hypothetical protein
MDNDKDLILLELYCLLMIGIKAIVKITDIKEYIYTEQFINRE